MPSHNEENLYLNAKYAVPFRHLTSDFPRRPSGSSVEWTHIHCHSFKIKELIRSYHPEVISC